MVSVKIMKRLLAIAFSCLLLACAAPAAAQLRVVSYNTLDKPFSAGDLDDVRTIFGAIAATDRNGVAKRPDIIGLQEQRRFGLTETTASRIAGELNDLFGVSSYESFFSGSGSDLIMAVYDTATVSLESTTQVFTSGPRPTWRYEFQPVGYTSDDATLYTYNSHLKAGSSSSDQSTRASEAISIRNNADALGANTNIVYMGDLNLRSFEASYANYRAAGVSQAIDPLGLASFPNSGVAVHLTQSTRTSNLSDGGASGGLDDRFDLQLVTSELLDGEGLSYLGPSSTGLSGLEHSTQAFGNDGVSYNTRINNTLVGRSQSSAVLNALHNFSDHLPVVVDYQLPAVMGYEVGTVPLTLEQGEGFSVPLTVLNEASVVAAVGADELDYSISTSGDVSGAFSGQEVALGDGDDYLLPLDTSVLGMRSGLITLTTGSEGAENSLIEIPVNFEVVAATLAGDYNDDGVVDAADYTVWRDGDSPDSSQAGYTVWANNYGATSPAIAVPEPASSWLVLLALAGLAARRS
ncbi:Endonuclease/Exonuclease/phosphatase family protein [Planctomycetes bacterium MalM25]|nr:Endonuclease/Exonuclease/phosphatase family protein [Planctomycetes bacterium MalM25]